MEVQIERLNDQGLGICYVDNMVTFVSDTVIGDIVEIEITKKTKKYNQAKVLKLVKPSILRVQSFCPYSKNCGGCSLSYMPYEETLRFKKQKLERILSKFAGIKKEIDVIASTNPLNYRNKITLHVIDGIVGYYEEESNMLCKVNACAIASPAINLFIKEVLKYGIKNGKVVIRSNYLEELLVHFICDDEIKVIASNLKIVGILKNDKLIYGQDYFIEVMNDMYFVVSYDSFFQINREICSVLFDLVKTHIIKNKVVLDLYCGVGTLGLNVANVEKQVIGIEIVKNAILNAVKTSNINKIENSEFLLGDVSLVIDKIKNKPDVIIVDPPRSGIDTKSISYIKKIAPEQIIYISCNPLTLARDLKLLDDYDISFIKGLDMFPYTYHVECVCVLNRR